MKNLKKVLSLVLALAMAFSLMSVAFAVDTASDYTDYSSITYQDAVDVMTAIGVFNGYDDGTSFNPSGTLTREQGAKIITYMMLGQTAADKLETSVAPFSDVPASKWSAGSIAYCAERGILAGDGSGKFNPEGALTGYAFAKMLLTALGYDAQIQNYLGSSWAINVAADAVSAGIDITGVVMSNNLTREQAAEMSFKTLEADVVDYSYKGSTVTTSDGTTVTVGASNATAKAAISGRNYNGATAESNSHDLTTLQFVEQHFPTLKKNTSASDAFNRPGTRWSLDGSSVSFVTDTVVAKFTSATTAADVATALAGYKVVFNSNGTNVTYNITNVNTLASGVSGQTVTYWNGNDTTYAVQTDTYARNPAIVYNTSRTIASSIAAITGNGKLVEFYANDDNEITRVVAVTYNVTEIANIVTNSSRTIYTLDNNSYYDYVDPNVSDTVVLHGDVAVGDVVTYTVVNGIAHIYPTTQVTGSQSSSNKGASQITVGGTVYPVAVNVYTSPTANQIVDIDGFVNSANEAVYYLDQFGNVVKSTTSTSSEYAYVLNVTASVSGGLDAGVPTVTARLILEDGTIVDRTVEVEKLTAGDTRLGGTLAVGDYVIKGTSIEIATGSDSAAATSVQTAMRYKAFGYSMSGNNVTLASVQAVTAVGTATAPNGTYSVSIDTQLTRNNNVYSSNGKTVFIGTDTVFVIYNSSNNTTSVYTGAANLPSTINNTSLSSVVAVYKANSSGTGASSVDSGTALVVYGYNGTQNALAAEASNYAYVDSSKYVSTLADGVTSYVYTATLADGTTVELSSSTLYTASGIYTYDDNNKIGSAAVTASTPNTLKDYRYIYSDTISNDNGFVSLTVDGATGYYTITSDTQIVYINENAGAVNGNGGFIVLQRDNGNTTNNIAAIFVTKANIV
jgi:hypothetical protein